MGPVPDMQSENALAAPSRNGTESLSAVLPEVQTREHHQCQAFYHRNQAARRQDAVLIANSIISCALFFEKRIFMDAIIYTTNTGSTERYARLLAQETGLPAYSLAEAKKVVPNGAEVIYLGWIAASTVKGYANAARLYQIKAVCAVGIGETGTQTDSVRKKASVPQSIPLFTLQGNLDVKKLRGIYRLMMEFMVKAAGKSLAAKENRIPEENDMLDMMLHGGERVKAENLRAVLEWYHIQK